MKTTVLYILCGLGFAGKSTLAKAIANHTGAGLVSLDALYFENEEKFGSTKDDEAQWKILHSMAREQIGNHLKNGNSVVYDDVNLRHEHRDVLRSLAKEHSAKSIVIYLNTPQEILLERKAKNKKTKERHDVKQKYLDEATSQFESPTPERDVIEFTPNTDLDEWLEKLDPTLSR